MASTLPEVQASNQDLEEFDKAYHEAVAREDFISCPETGNKPVPVIWSPQEGSQTDFLSCPLFEVLYHGTRGPGKTDALLMAFLQNVGRGFGADWRGIIFRHTYPQLADVVAKSEKWFPRIFPGAKFNRGKMIWTFPNGEALLFRHIARASDYSNYHGHSYPFMGFEELTTWANDECYKAMISCCRSSVPGIPRMLRATTNPYGVGHNWVMDRFNLHGQWWKTVIQMEPKDSKGRIEKPRVAIHGHIDENKIMLAADPDYKSTIISSATSEAMIQAWLHGSWDFVAGGMFDDVWDNIRNNVPVFDVPPSWRIDRAFDWGSSRPFSVGWYAQSDGSDLMFRNGRVVSTVRGDLFRIAEWYGWSGRANEGLKMLAVDIARGIVERELKWGLRDGQHSRVDAGPADSSIFTTENGVCIAQDMQQDVRIGGMLYPGVTWTPSDKRSGSRKMGWEMMRKMMKAAKAEPGCPREKPGLFVIGDRNKQFLRTVVTLPRDEKDMDDVDTDAEDHIGDEVRYRVRNVGNTITQSVNTGLF